MLVVTDARSAVSVDGSGVVLIDMLRRAGLPVRWQPLLRVNRVPFEIPDADFAAVLLTSTAACVPEAARVAPAHCVGPATARVAAAAGFNVQRIGHSGAAQMLADLPRPALYLSGSVTRLQALPPDITRCVVYHTQVLPVSPAEVSPLDMPIFRSRQAAQAWPMVAETAFCISPMVADVTRAERIFTARTPADLPSLIIQTLMIQALADNALAAHSPSASPKNTTPE